MSSSARRSLAALVAIGCAGAPGDAAPARELPSPYTYEPEDAGGGVDPAVMQAELQAVVDRIRTFHGRAILDAYGQARGYGDTRCPVETETDTVENGHSVYFEGLCVAGTRYWFKGPMTTYAFVDTPLDAFEVFDFAAHDEHLGVGWTGAALKGQTDIYDARSDLDFNCSCTALDAMSATDGERRWFSYVDGPSHWVASDAPAAWIDGGLQVQLYVVLARTDDAAWRARVAGTVTGATDTYGTIDLDLTLSGTHGADGAVRCDAGSGTVGMRYTTTGVRTELVLEAPDGGCSLCGPVGDETVCVDVSALQAWDTAPW